MNIRNERIRLIGELILLSVVLLSCSNEEYGTLTINTHYIPPRINASLSTLALPSGSDKVSISITGTDFSPIVKDVSIATNPSGVTISSIPAGENRIVNISIKNAVDAVIAKGKTTGVKINAGSVNTVDILITQVGVFTQLNSKVVPRAFAVSSSLSDGTYMIMGGVVGRQSSCGNGCVQLIATQETEIYEPNTGTFRQGAQMKEPRVLFTANRLSDGSIAVVGGTDIVNVSCNITACSITVPQDHVKTSIEVFDPVSNSFYKAQSLAMPRAGHSANILTGDNVLISGGISTNGPTNSAELLNIKTGKDVSYTMSFSRVFQAAVAYSDGDILLAGGNTSNNKAENFQLSGFTVSNNITCTTYFPSSAFINANREIIINGGVNAYRQPVSQLMVVDPMSRVILSYHSMLLPRALFSDIVLGDGNVLIAGGVTVPVFTVSDSAEVFNPISKLFLKYPLFSIPRAGYAAQSLHDGSALIVSGFSNINPLIGDIRFIDTAEIYNP
jgi:hypothetical protein